MLALYSIISYLYIQRINIKNGLNMKQDFQAILAKEMSRKEFLRIMGASFLGVIGVTGLLQNLHRLTGTSQQTTSRTTSKSAGRGYGDLPYGK
jgi:hypothetical protein